MFGHRDARGKDRETLTHVFFSENKISVSEHLNLRECSSSIDADMEKFLLFFFSGHVLLSSNPENCGIICILLSKDLNKFNQTDV